ncbi:uncharacterized protein [Ptychodera flava]|uniref:uncharacterized protein n=1 Tax=Ptychodera flava TaxID=63121 RepID=UPI00396A31A4
MDVVTKTLVFVFLLTFVIGSGNANDQCYFCTWPATDNCLSPSGSTDTCPGSKCSTTATYNDGALTLLSRICIPVCVESDVTAGEVRNVIDCCDGDKCNSKVYSHSGQIVMSFVALFVSATAAIYHTAL